MVYSRAIEDKFLTHLCSDQGISEKYSDAMAEEWTEAATMALVKAGEEAFKDQAVQVTGAAKGHVDPYRRSEYFTADVVVYDDDSWGPPLLVVQHLFQSELDYRASGPHLVVRQRYLCITPAGKLHLLADFG